MLLSQIVVDGQTLRPRDRIEFTYHGETRHGSVEEIRVTNLKKVNVLCKTSDGYRQFRSEDMADIRTKSFWGYVRRLMK